MVELKKHLKHMCRTEMSNWEMKRLSQLTEERWKWDDHRKALGGWGYTEEAFINEPCFREAIADIAGDAQFKEELKHVSGLIAHEAMRALKLSPLYKSEIT